jgi:hypothetical protein
LLSYGEASFTLNFFANGKCLGNASLAKSVLTIFFQGTTGNLSVPVMTSFFRDQRFPTNNWHRRASAGGFDLIGDGVVNIESAHPVAPGVNNAQGQYVADTLTVSPVSELFARV